MPTTFAPEPGSISPPLDLLPRDILPGAREAYNAQNPPDPLAEFERVEPSFQDAGGAKKIDLNAREKLGGFKDPLAEFQKADPIPGFEKADDLDVKSVDELDKDRDNFHPAEYFSSNPDVANDPKKLQKLLDVFRKRQEEGLTAKGVVQAAVKNTPGLVGDIAGGIKRLGERVIDVTAQPVVNVLGSLATGDIFDDQKRKAFFNEAKKSIKKGTAEVGSGSEAATVGLVDLARTGSRKVSNAYTPVPFSAMGDVGSQEPIPLKKPLSDQELLAQLSDDASFRQTADAAMRGEGEAAKNFGLDKETLAKQGIELDEKAIQQLSLVDPITMVATGGAFKLVGLGGKVLATAKTLQGAEKVAEGLSKVAKVSRTAKFVGGTLELAGKTAAETKGFGGRSLTAAGFVRGGLTEAAAAKVITKGLDIFALPIIKKTGKIVERAGKLVAEKPLLDVSRAGAESSVWAQRVAGLVKGGVVKPIESAVTGAKVIGKGAVEGLVAGSPFAIAAQDDETAGSLLGAGAALGAAGGAGSKAFRVVKDAASRRFFGENRPVLPDIASPGYGQDAALDATHEANIQKLSAQDASELNNFREALRQQGGEIYAVDQPTFRQKVAQEYRARTGEAIDPTLLDTYENHSAFFDETNGDRKVVYLNSDTAGLQHDAGHIFDAILSPEKRAELRTAVESAFTPEQRQAFRDTYERRVGSKISDTSAVDEFIAEQFSAIFHNTPVTELNAPKSLLNIFIDAAAEGAEALGIDLTAGATTPNLGAPVSVGIRQLFRNAAGDVMRANIEGVPASKVVTPDFGGEPPPPPPGAAPIPTPPKGPGPAPAPANVVPLRPEARPIRPSGTGLPAPVTPEARAAAAARFAETGIESARLNAASDPAISRAVEDVSRHMEAGNPVLEVEHLGIVSEGTPDSPEGRTSRRATQAAGYEALKGELSRAGAPADLVASHLKTFVPVRWTQQGGTPTLVAMSLDKALQNIKRVGSDPKAASLIPYPTENGKLTPQGWRDAVSDLKAYAENQANGRRGDGGRLTVPEAGELSIPIEDPSYTPQPLSPEKADFQNLIMGLGTPETARRLPKGQTPGNIKGQILAEANIRPTEAPVSLSPRRAGKQAFVDFPPRTIQEVNPLRNRLKKAGAPSVGELIEVTERIRAIDIEKVTPRPDINFKAPVTDVIRGGFLPAPTEFREKSLGGRTVEEFAKYVLDAPVEEWRAAAGNMTGGQTGGSWNLGLGLKDRGDLAVLKKYQDAASTQSVALMDKIKAVGAANAPESLFTEMQIAGSKAMFFREALEAAQGTGSAGAAFAKDRMGFSVAKPPFPVTEKTQGTAAAGTETKPVTVSEGGQFLPRTESGKTLEKQGYKIKPFGELGVRGVEIFDRDNNRAGEIISEEVRPNEVSVNNVLVRPNFRGKGVGEALYRELAAQLKEDGVTTVVGDVVAPEPLALRRKVFGDFETLDVNGQPASIEDALTAANMTRKGVQFSHVEAANRITPESRFLPAEQLDLGTSEQTPELRVLTAAAGGTPPIEPPGFRPPPVAAGVAAKDEEAPRFAPKPDETIRDLAKSYADGAGLPYVPKGGYAEVNPDLAKRLADFYEAAKSNPNDPDVKSSYDALIRETEEQGKSILAAGYKIEPWTGAGEPYKDSASAIADVRDNKHLFFRKTEGAFAGTADNPMLAESSIVPGQSVNDVFRWVHDFFGHSKEGFQFGPRGEFNAWRSHSEMYSPEAQGALAAETLAQNSWVNFGKHLEGKNIPQAERPFAEQKNIVIPEALIAEAAGFQPRTESGRKLEEKGYKIVASGERGLRKVTIKDSDGADIAQIKALSSGFERAEIQFVNKIARAPKGIGEVLYRELGAQLKEDGVTEVGGNVVSPEPLAIRRKIFGDFASIDLNGEPATYEQAIAAAERIKARTENEVAAIEPVNTISEATRFLPKVKRDAQGRPLTKTGEIDYPRWAAEGAATRRKQEAEPIEESVPKGKISKNLPPPTGWILPNKKFVPLDTAYHEQYLAENFKELNQRFKTKFSASSSVADRLDALNSGFVRFRYDARSGGLSVEANAEKWPALKPAVKDRLFDYEDKIDSLTISLLNNRALQVDSATVPRMQELSGPQKFDAISEAVDSLRTKRD